MPDESRQFRSEPLTLGEYLRGAMHGGNHTHNRPGGTVVDRWRKLGSRRSMMLTKAKADQAERRKTGEKTPHGV